MTSREAWPLEAQPSYRDDRVSLYLGDSVDVLAQLPDNSVESVCTDPPFAMSFRGNDWDTAHPRPRDRSATAATAATNGQPQLREEHGSNDQRPDKQTR